MLASAIVSLATLVPLPSSVVVGRIQLLVVVGQKSCFLALCLSARRGYSQVRTMQLPHSEAASKSA